MNNPRCISYATQEDKCLECAFGFYASPDGLTCVEYPTGISGCRLYNSKYNCLQCNEDSYLQGDYCIPILSEEVIENCRFYVDKFNCETCLEGFVLKDKKCLQILAQNCETLESITSCGSCAPLFGFVETNGVKSCVAQTIPNCVRIDPAPIATLA